MTKTNWSNKINLLIKLLFLLIAIEIGWFLTNSPIIHKSSSLNNYAEKVLIKCSKESYKQACYDKEIPKLMDYISMEDAFKITSIIQEKDTSYQYCHILGHKLSAREVNKDPSKWKNIVSRCPSGICSNGCIHGAFQEKFRSESLTDKQIESIKPDLQNICEERQNWHPTGLEQGSCYHALGHLTMYLNSAYIDKAISLCKEISIKDSRRDFSHLCFDGVFMQIFQPLEPEDFTLVKGKQPRKEEVLNFCSKYSLTEKSSCLSESWPLFINEIKESDGLVAFCMKEEPNEQSRCFDSMEYVLTTQFNFDLDKMANLCKNLPTELIGQCFGNASTRLIETDYRNIEKSVNFCKESQKYDKTNRCFNELIKYSDYNFHTGSKEFFKLCNTMPDPWKTYCLNKSKK